MKHWVARFALAAASLVSIHAAVAQSARPDRRTGPLNYEKLGLGITWDSQGNALIDFGSGTGQVARGADLASEIARATAKEQSLTPPNGSWIAGISGVPTAVYPDGVTLRLQGSSLSVLTGQPNGVAGLDDGSKVPAVNLGNVGGASYALPGGVPRFEWERFAETINIRDKGAKQDVLGLMDGVMAPGSNVLFSPSANFTSADVGKRVVNTGSGTDGVSQSGTILAVIDQHHITVSFTAVLGTPWSYTFSLVIVTPQSGSGSYVPGETFRDASSSNVITPSTWKIMATQVQSATVASAGTGGTDGPCVLTGTTGTTRQGDPDLFQINATIVNGSLVTPLGSFVDTGAYLVNPPNLTAEPVTGCGLVGATLNLQMGPQQISVTDYGQYVTAPTGTFPITYGGSGTGLVVRYGGTAQGGGVVTYYTDDSQAWFDAITAANAQAAAGRPTLVTAPSGISGIAAVTLPRFAPGAGVLGTSGPMASRVYADPSYLGDVFYWSEDNFAKHLPFDGTTWPQSPPGPGPFAHNITVSGDRTSPNIQNAFMAYDRNDAVSWEDLNVYYLTGRAYCLSCELKNAPVAWTRESRLARLRANHTGNATSPAFEIGAYTQGLSDDIRVDTLDIFGQGGPGIVLRAGTGASIGYDHFTKVRVEGLQWNKPGFIGDNIVIGDTDPAYGGKINNIYFNQVQSIDPYAGYAAFRVTAPSIDSQPYQIEASGMGIGGGVPYGKGLQLDYIRSSRFEITAMYSWGNNLQIGPTPNVGGDVLISSPATTKWSTNTGGAPLHWSAFGIGATPDTAALSWPTLISGDPTNHTPAYQVQGAGGIMISGLGYDSSVQYGALVDKGFTTGVLQSNGTYSFTTFARNSFLNIGSPISTFTLNPPTNHPYQGQKFTFGTLAAIGNFSITPTDGSSVDGWTNGATLQPGVYSWIWSVSRNTWEPDAMAPRPGAASYVPFGTTFQRLTLPLGALDRSLYYDTALGQLMLWNGTAWVSAQGSSVASGAFASKPSGAAQGTLYFATDIGSNGCLIVKGTATWKPASGSCVLYQIGVSTTTTSSISPIVNLAVATIPAGLLSPNGRLRVAGLCVATGANAAKVCSATFSGTSGAITGNLLYSFTITPAADLTAWFQRDIWNAGAVNSQIEPPTNMSSPGLSTAPPATFSLNTAVATYINFNANVVNAGDTVGYGPLTVEWMEP